MFGAGVFLIGAGMFLIGAGAFLLGALTPRGEDFAVLVEPAHELLFLVAKACRTQAQ